jgi:hypothetical protein
MYKKSISYIKDKIKKMQKTANGLNTLIQHSHTLNDEERENFEQLKKTTIKEIDKSKKELHQLKNQKDT